MGLNIGKFTSFLLFTLVNLIGNRGGLSIVSPKVKSY